MLPRPRPSPAACALLLLLAGGGAARGEEPWGGTGTGTGSGSWSVAADPREVIAQTRAEERALLDEIAAFDADLRGLGAELMALEEQRAALESRQVTLRAERAAAEAALEAQRRAISGWVRALYRIHRQGIARILFGADSPHDLRRRGRYLLAIIAADADRFVALREAAERRRAILAEAEAGTTRLQALTAELQQKEAELREQRTRKLEFRDDILARRQEALALQRELGRAEQDPWASVAAGAGRPPAATAPYAMSDNWAGAGAGGGAGGACPEEAGRFREQYGRLPWPAAGQLVRRYGAYTDPRTDRQEHSKGLQIAGRYGAPVLAVYGGVVEIAGYLRGYGETVSIDHGDYTTVYAHLSGIEVQKGQAICPGDVVGRMGSSGLTDSTQDIVGFQIRYNNSPQDPLPWLQPL